MPLRLVKDVGNCKSRQSPTGAQPPPSCPGSRFSLNHRTNKRPLRLEVAICNSGTLSPKSLFECAISRIYATSAVSALSLEQALTCRLAALCLPDPCGLGSDSHGGKVFSGKLLELFTQTGSKKLRAAPFTRPAYRIGYAVVAPRPMTRMT